MLSMSPAKEERELYSRSIAWSFLVCDFQFLFLGIYLHINGLAVGMRSDDWSSPLFWWMVIKCVLQD